jgi:hypothetical protein
MCAHIADDQDKVAVAIGWRVRKFATQTPPIEPIYMIIINVLYCEFKVLLGHSIRSLNNTKKSMRNTNSLFTS